MMPLVSVIMTSYNYGKYIEDSINSLLNQSYANFELILINNASTDNTKELIKKYKDKRIKVVHLKKNLGFSGGINTGLMLCKGKYITFLNSDDIYSKEKIKFQVKFLEDNSKFGAVFSRAELIDEYNLKLPKTHPANVYYDTGQKTRYQWLNYFFFFGFFNMSGSLCFPSAFIKRDIVRKIGFFDRRLAVVSDYDYWIRLCKLTDIYILQDTLVKYRIPSTGLNLGGNNQISHNRNFMEYRLILPKNYLNLSLNEFCRIFPKFVSKKVKLHKSLIPYYLSIMCFSSKFAFHHDLGIKLIWDLMSDEKIVKILEKNYKFTYKKLHELTGKYNLYELSYHLNLKYQYSHNLLEQINKSKFYIAWRAFNKIKEQVGSILQ